jgi:hypothetical protein
VRRASGLLVLLITLAAVARAQSGDAPVKPSASARAPAPPVGAKSSPGLIHRATGASSTRVTVAPVTPADPGTGGGSPEASGWGGFLGELGPHIERSLAAAKFRPILWGGPPPPQPPSGGRHPGDPSAGPAAPGGQPPTGEQAGDRPMRLELGPAIPNPSTGTVTFNLALPAPAEVRVSVIDVAGRIVHESIESRNAGRHVLSWSGRTPGDGRVVPGIYFVRVVVNGLALGTRRWVVMR